MIRLILGLIFIMNGWGFMSSKDKPKTDTESDLVVIRAADELTRKYGFKLVGIGGGTNLENKIHTISMSLQLNHPLSIEEARKMMVDSTSILLSKINNNDDIRSLLAVYPFPIENISIAFFLNRSNGDELYHPNIDLVGLCVGKIDYSSSDAADFYIRHHQLKESYEDAVRIVEQQKLQKPQE